ncbi:choloylglycine hydrolase family protein [Pandoraea bronchicola]|uniref:Choloylglycine hydrolase n=1 Tax=Pandoraea bronchicola TaxID=2508287 RepID=A0A5E5BYL4_9BURK|nr:choloylglycine hydrolase family protein [Pandoraea bronchicola]VVE90507.1 choloylglycine hydrolase [Pandoraea bronchicola]
MRNNEAFIQRWVGKGISTLVGVAVLPVLLVSNVALACTSFILNTSDGGRVYARTMEFAFPMKSDLILIPRGFALNATLPGKEHRAEWHGRYAAIGMNGLGLPSLVDGMNENGLAGGILYFPGFAQYTKQPDANGRQMMAPWDFLTWALTNFASVAEVKAALPKIALVDMKQADMGIVPPVHFTLHDRTGASIVIEPIHGELKVYDNPIGVLTNSPPFEWHMINLRNYLNLTTADAPTKEIGGVKLAPLGQGSGLQGIPGDTTPPARFIRAIGYTISVQRVPSGDPGVRLAEHVANSFDIPKGWVKTTEADAPEYTQWTVFADLKRLRYYIKTYDNPVLRGVGFDGMDLNGTSIVKIPFQTSSAIGSLTDAPVAVTYRQ